MTDGARVLTPALAQQAASSAFPIWDDCISMMLAVQTRALAWEAADRAR